MVLILGFAIAAVVLSLWYWNRMISRIVRGCNKKMATYNKETNRFDSDKNVADNGENGRNSTEDAGKKAVNDLLKDFDVFIQEYSSGPRKPGAPLFPDRPVLTGTKEQPVYVRCEGDTYGTKENPYIMDFAPEFNRLVYDGEYKRWVLTDGLGNGVLR